MPLLKPKDNEENGCKEKLDLSLKGVLMEER
jgi:hypothetical protein